MPTVKKTKTKKKTKATEKTVKKVKRVKKEKKEVEKKVKKKVEEKKVEEKEIKPDRYYEGVGRRKRAVARARIFIRGEKGFSINKKSLEEYFPIYELQKTALASLDTMKCLDKFKVSIIVRGGGLNAQAEAVRHGIARALLLFNPDFRKRLKKAGFLKRDSRMRERKKPGLKRARRAPQWKKR
jgi:small subunit ribosomal protein S9